MLFLRPDGALLVGEAAARRAVAEPGRAAREFKRRMGDDVPIRLDGHGFHAHELTGHLLRWVVETVSEREGERPGHVVLTHPAGWGEHRRGLLTAAAGTAGLDDVGLLPEPVAAATWYAAQERVPPGALIGIYDLGGGTFDASVVRKTGTGFEVYGEPGGDDSIGGVDFDHALLRHVAGVAGVDLDRYYLGGAEDPAVASALAQLAAAVVDAKEALSADVEAVVPVLLPGLSRQVTVGRAQFEALVRPRILATVQLFAQIVTRAGTDPTRLKAVLLVGGSSRIPLVTSLLRAELGVPVAVDAHPKYAVSLGAAIAAAPRVAHVERIEPVTTPGTPAVAAAVDLAGTGLTAPTDVPVTPVAATSGQPVVTDRDEPVRVRTRDDGYPTRGRRTLVLVFVAAVLAAVAVVAVALRGGHPAASRSGGPPAPAATQAPPTAPTTAAPSAGTARLDGTALVDPPGADAMRGVTVGPDGSLVAVGLSVDLRPRAWVRQAGQPWRFVQPPSTGTGALADVASAGSRLVAVGWTRADAGAAQHAAVWVSDRGDPWRRVEPAGDRAGDPAGDPAAGLTELTAVVATRDGGFLAIGVDRGTDGVDGDGAVLRSADGLTWHRLAATGLDGAGPQEVHRVIQAADGRFVAVGAALTGARRGPAVWTSTDGLGWQSAGSPLPGAPTLWAVHQQRDGTLITCGSQGTVDQPSVGCWLERGSGDGGPDWQPLDVVVAPGSAPALSVYSLADTPDGLVAVGAGRGPAGVDATAWTVRVQLR